MIEVESLFQLTAIVPANSAGPYAIDAGTPVTLAAANTHADATYEWDLGDGTTATTASVTHVYAEDGIYIAKLTVTVTQPGGARTEHFAEVRVRNVPPTVDAGPDRTVDEGDVVTFVATFQDPEWPDTHEATWDWGDYQLPTAGVVSETNSPPASTGNVTGKHAWGDNGLYTVKVTVRDDDGGVGTDTLDVSVLNVPPVVDAGPPMYAYRCTVITLEGGFEDPGWLDTHTATWDFGDCTPAHTAIVHEQHDPPKGTGVALGSHVYDSCGVFQATCTVVDDDGGVGTDATVVRVVDVENRGFEDGFRGRNEGAVANTWEPYVIGKGHDRDVFAAEEFLVHGGQRSQHIHVRGQRAGIYQHVGANPGWDYQVAAWYSLDERGAGVARLGFDPEGGTNPDAATVVWDQGHEHQRWAHLAVRAGATAERVTIFLEAGETEGEALSYFDDVALVPIQPFCPKKPPAPEPRIVCVDFSDVPLQTELPPSYTKDGFTFRSRDKAPQRVVGYGDPAGQAKLQLKVTGVEIDLPYTSDRVTLTIWKRSQKAIKIVATDGTNQVASASLQGSGTVHLDASGMEELIVYGGDGEAGLVQVCASEQFEEEESGAPREPTDSEDTEKSRDRRPGELARTLTRRALEPGAGEDDR
jgi:PKD repeat protein